MVRVFRPIDNFPFWAPTALARALLVYLQSFQLPNLVDSFVVYRLLLPL